MSQCVIVGGGECKNPARAREWIQPDDFIIAADRGLLHLQAMGIEPHLLVGDFDSYPGRPPDKLKCVALPKEKDDTDMLYAARLGLERGYRHFLLLGGMGGRLDHTMANLAVLCFLKRQGCHGILADQGCVAQMVCGEEISLERTGEFRYLSVFAYDGAASGVSLRGVKYPLDGGTLTGDYPIGCSNEIIEHSAYVGVGQGMALVMQCAESPW